VTVVTPSYTQAAYLEQTIASVLDQGYPNLEYIVVDGGSTDGSVDVIKRHESSLSWWVSEADRGQSHAINKGWQRATGDILAFLNSDDLYWPNAIRASVTALTANPRAGLVYGPARVFDARGVLYQTRPPRHDPRRLVARNYLQQPTVFLRRSLVESIGLLDEDLHFCFDYDYWLRASRVSAFARQDSVTAGFRVHGSSKTGSQQAHFARERVAILDRTFAAQPALHADYALRRHAYLRDVLCAVGTTSGFSSEERREALRRLRDLGPPPTVKELTRVVADWDAELSEGHNTGAPGTLRGAHPLDRFGILPALIDEGLLTLGAAERVGRRSLVYRSLRENHHRRNPHEAARRLMGAASRAPDLLSTRAWWGALARSTPLRSAKPRW
jgi:GT2 family glycosyltransferase